MNAELEKQKKKEMTSMMRREENEVEIHEEKIEEAGGEEGGWETSDTEGEGGGWETSDTECEEGLLYPYPPPPYPPLLPPGWQSELLEKQGDTGAKYMPAEVNSYYLDSRCIR